MASAEFGAALLADFDRRIELDAARRLRPSPHPFGARSPGAFGGGPDAVVPAHARTRDWPAPSQLMLNIMAGMDPNTAAATASTSTSTGHHEALPKSSDATMPLAFPQQQPAAATGAPHPDFQLASAAITHRERTAFAAESSAMAQKRRLLDHSAGVECSYMGVGSGAGAWDAGSEETARRVATLQARLQQRLGPEYVSTRAGPSGGPKVSYIEGWKAIDLANEVFGFNGWSSSIVSIDVDYLEENPETGRVNVAVSVTVRITLRDGTFHEDVGYGSMDNSKSRAAALEKSKKEAVTDALKRTLRTFGRVLGNCLYDKQFLRDVSKVTVPPLKFDPSTLHRRPEFANAAAENKSAASALTGESSTAAGHEAATALAPVPPTPARTTMAPPQRSMTASAAPAPRSAAIESEASSSVTTMRNLAHTGSTAAPGARSKTVPAARLAESPRKPPAQPADKASAVGNSDHGPGHAAAGTAAASSAADKARLAQQRRAEAQKRLARTKSLQASSAGNVSTASAAGAGTSIAAELGPGSGAATPAKNASMRMELPSFGPQIRSAKAEQQQQQQQQQQEAGPAKVATPFGPRFMKPKPHDDSAIFFESDAGTNAEDDGQGGSSMEFDPELERELGLVEEKYRARNGAAAAAEEEEEAQRRMQAAVERAPSVGRFTGLTPNSAQLLRSGTTSLSAAAGGGGGADSHTHGHAPMSSTPAARKHSLSGPLQPRRANGGGASGGGDAAGAAAAAHGARADASRSGAGNGALHAAAGIENVGLAERMSGVGSGVGKVRGVATAGSGAGGVGSGGGFAPASSSMRSAVTAPGLRTIGPAKRGLGDEHVGMGHETDASKRMRR